jgi:predicted MFS family arabinose efflux permease
MGVGVAIPLLRPGIASIIVASVCIGSTVMVVTLAALQEARRVAPTNSARLIAGMTAAFAAGQMLGPMFIGLFGHEQRGLQVSLGVASVALALSATALLVSDSQEQKRERDRRAGPGRIEGACKQT